MQMRERLSISRASIEDMSVKRIPHDNVRTKPELKQAPDRRRPEITVSEQSVTHNTTTAVRRGGCDTRQHPRHHFTPHSGAESAPVTHIAIFRAKMSFNEAQTRSKGDVT